jgi:carbonic anhydrase
MAPQLALAKMKAGNERYLSGDVEAKVVCGGVRGALKNLGQRPMAAVLGCADSRVALDFVFDTNPGDLFVVRNAGNVCGDKSGGLIGSLEYSVGNLQTQLLVVLGHTNCGAVAAATGTRISKSTDGLSECLKALVERLEVPVDAAISQHPNGEQSGIVELGIKLNVWHTMEELIRNSSVLKSALLDGKLEIHGGVYCLENGTVDWMGQHPEQSRLLDGSADVICGACAK